MLSRIQSKDKGTLDTPGSLNVQAISLACDFRVGEGEEWVISLKMG